VNFSAHLSADHFAPLVDGAAEASFLEDVKSLAFLNGVSNMGRCLAAMTDECA
jgi:hypothetical protein